MAADLDASRALNLRARLLLERHRPDEAEDFFRQSLASNPENDDSHYGLAQCISHDSKRLHLALEEMNIAVSLDPDWAGYHAFRALLLRELGRSAMARDAITTALELAPDDPYVWYCAGIIHSAAGDWPKAEEAARKSLEFAPGDVTFANLLATALRMQNKDQENAELLRANLERDPENADTHANVGWSLLSRDRDQAERHFMEALRLHPHHEGARRGMLKAFQTRNRIYGAIYRLQDRLRSFSLWQLFGSFIALAGGIFLAGFGLEELGLRGAGSFGFALGIALMVLCILIATYGLLGHVIVLLDPRARLALTTEEKFTAWFVIALALFITVRVTLALTGALG